MTTLADINATLQDQNRTMETQTRNLTFLVDDIRSSRLDDLEKEREAKRDIEVATRGAKQSRGGFLSMPGMGALGAIGGAAFGAVGSLLASAGGILSKIPLLGPLLTPLISLGSFLVRKSPFILALMVIKDNWETIEKTWKNVQESDTFKWFSEQFNKIDFGGIVNSFFDYIRKGFMSIERLTAGDWKGFIENLDGLLVGLGTIAVITKKGRGLLSAAALAALSAAFGIKNPKVPGGPNPPGTRPPSSIGTGLGAAGAAAAAAASAPKYKPNQFKVPISMVGPNAVKLPDAANDPNFNKAKAKFPNFGKMATFAKRLPFVGTALSLVELASILGSDAPTDDKIAAISGLTFGIGGAILGGGLGTILGGPIGAVLGSVGGYLGGEMMGKAFAQWLLGKPVTALPEWLNKMINNPEPVAATSSGKVQTRGLGGFNDGQSFVLPSPRAKMSPPVQATAPAISMLASENAAAANKQVVVVQDNSNKVVSNSTSQGLVMPSTSVFDNRDPNRFYPTRGAAY